MVRRIRKSHPRLPKVDQVTRVRHSSNPCSRTICSTLELEWTPGELQPCPPTGPASIEIYISEEYSKQPCPINSSLVKEGHVRMPYNLPAQMSKKATVLHIPQAGFARSLNSQRDLLRQSTPWQGTERRVVAGRTQESSSARTTPCPLESLPALARNHLPFPALRWALKSLLRSSCTAIRGNDGFAMEN